ncbi:MAG TPA: two-component regulator propeller domain-containing protein [Saprospiraceae bacterium]|nr:two-component regulator propeller domain-containing protein [Saprospiraceae bacterium]
MNKIFFSLIFSFLGTLSLLAQAPQYRFISFPQDNVLSHSSITAVLQDHRGFLWIGTWSGLIRYDGYNVVQYRQEPGNINGLESNKITCLFEDSKNRLWIGTQDYGIYLYERSGDTFKHYKRDPGNMNSLSNDKVWTITEDSYGDFWIGTENGLNQFNPEKETFVHFMHHPEDMRSLSFDFVTTIFESQDRTVWIGTENGLNMLVRRADGIPDYFIRYSLSPDHTTLLTTTHDYIYKIKSVFNDPNSLWIGTKAGLKKITYATGDPRKMETITYHHHAGNAQSISNNYVSDVWEGDNGQVWIATFSGLNVMNTRQETFTCFLSDENHPDALNNNFIRSVYADQSMNLWIGTEGGLYKLNLKAKPFVHIQPDRHLTTNSQVITSIVEASDQRHIWIGTRGGGFHSLSLDADGIESPVHIQLPVKHSLESSGFISDMSLDKEGFLWLSTLGAGAIRIKEEDLIKNPTHINLQQYSMGLGLDHLTGEHIMSVMASQSGDVWFGGWNFGLARYDHATRTFEKYETTSDFKANLKAYPNVHFLESKEDNKSFLWVGTRGGGLFKLIYDPVLDRLDMMDQYTSESTKKGAISNNYINCMYYDDTGRLWIATDNGLNQFHPETKTFTFLLEKDGLPNGNIQAILQDHNNRLWVSTQRGIASISFPKNSMHPDIKHYDASDGLQANYFYDDAMCQTSTGLLAFGGVNGMSLFNPDIIGIDGIAPRMTMTGFRLFNDPVDIGEKSGKRIILNENISETKNIELSHKDNVISFEFAGIQFSDPGKVTYAHKLDGFDPDWVYSNASERIAHYTNIPHGNYTFRVKAANGDGFWSDEISVALLIHPPIWATVWAYLFYILTTAALFIFIRRIMLMKSEFRHSLQLEKIEREKLEEVNQMKLSFFTNISHELRTPLTLILSPLQQLIRERHVNKKLHNTISQMHSNATRLLTMINQLLDIRKSEAGLMKLSVQQTDLVQYINEIVLSFKSIARERNIHLKFIHPHDKFQAWIDQDQMEKVLFNLLSNAFKYTPDDGFIHVYMDNQKQDALPELSKPFIHIHVKDSGCGITADQLPLVFDQFYQVDENKPHMHNSGGTGIGLALAKNIMEVHHGKIYAESTPGAGSTFHLEILTGESHFTDEEKIPPATFSNINKGFVLPLSDDGSGLHTSDHTIEPGSGDTLKKTKSQRSTVLLVEDNQEIREYLKENLSEFFHILEAVDGVDGLEKAKKSGPDLIVADIAMPRMDGIEMCQQIKTDILTSHIPLILLTARTSLFYKLNSYETGADDYITKPFNMHLLTTRIHNLIDSRTQLREKFAKNFELSPTGVVMNKLDEEFLNKIKAIVEKHMDDSTFSVEQLAAGLLVSRMQLYRKLKTLVGQSPNQIIRSIRLKRAAQLLATRHYNIADVTYMVGYNDLKSFRDQFKKEFGVSPSGYESPN